MTSDTPNAIQNIKVALRQKPRMDIYTGLLMLGWTEYDITSAVERAKTYGKRTYYPVYCFDCQNYWYVQNRDGNEQCPRCHGLRTNKGKS